MPWSRPRPSKPGETGSLRPINTTDKAIHGQHDEKIPPTGSDRLGSDAIDAQKSPSPLKKSFEPPKEEQSTLTRERPRSPVTREQIPSRQRFSMLRFRHASDPQISKTAKDQALIDRPPMPAGKPCP